MLGNFPTEITMNIAAFVNKPDLLNLRLTSQRLRQETWRVFASAFFKIIYFDFCVGSFANLQKISQHDDLRLFVRELRNVADRVKIQDEESKWQYAVIGVTIGDNVPDSIMELLRWYMTEGVTEFNRITGRLHEDDVIMN
ncbi:hypothetical protein N0V93_002293 [Gnomoniopsis smithogilvyi]|uniref:F-box domain-containing protein n=1 Tax=Gnomoniopsis smithogilvyi TaxID=1191159 RepID=A0A9W9CY11_9PEZI|nr:hypothetical protein N0V93_002293 [Gnomoniopsis smithogilvyi]